MAISVADKNFLVSLYVGYFNRAPDPAGLQYWIEQVEAGRDTNTIAADFAASTEAKALYPFLTTPDVSSPTAFITSVYQNLFNRAPDAAGLAFWEGQLSAGTVSAADMIDAIIKGATTAPDSTIMNNKVEVGLDFATDAGNTAGFTYNDAAATAATTAISGVTDDAATVAAAKSTTDAFFTNGGGTAATTHTLTTGTDNVAGGAGNDNIVGVSDGVTSTTVGAGQPVTETFGGLDAIDGGAGTDTLTLTNATGVMALDTSVTVENVENLSLTSATGGVTADVQGFVGLETVTVDQRATAGSNIDTKSNATSVSVKGGTGAAIDDNGAAGKDTLASVSLENITGGVAIGSDALTTLSLKGTTGTAVVTNTTANHNLDVTVDNVTAGGVRDDVASSVSVTASGTKSSGLVLTTDAATKVSFAGDKALSIALADSGVNPAVVGEITSSNTAGVTITSALGNSTSFTGAAGKDSVAINNLNTKAVAMGDGDDTVAVSGTVLGAGGTIDAGAGTDTLVLTSSDAAALSAATTFEGRISNFEKVSLGVTAEGVTDTVNMANLDDINHVVTAGTAPGTVAGGTQESSVFTFADLKSGQSVSVNGLTLTATDDVTGTELAAAFVAEATTGNVNVAGAETVASTSTNAGAVVTAVANAVGNSVDLTVTNAAAAAPTAPTVVTGLQGNTPVNETATVVFDTLLAGQSLTIDGVVVTATGSAALGAEVAAAFATGATSGAAVVSGVAATAFTSAIGANGETVVFTSVTPATNVADLAIVVGGGATAPTPTIVQGEAAATETATVTWQSLLSGQSVTVAGRTVTALDDLTAAQVDAIFEGGVNTALGAVSGTLTGWTLAAGTATTTVFTSASPATEVVDLTASVTNSTVPANPSVAITQGTATGPGGVLVLNGLASGSTVELTGANAGSTTVNLASTTGTSDVVNLLLNTAGLAGLAAGAVNAAGVETVAITTADSATATNPTGTGTIALNAADATTVSVSGNHGVTFTGLGLGKVTTLDASGVTADVLTANLTAAQKVAADGAAGAINFTSQVTDKSVTITTGNGDDVIDAGTVGSTGTSDAVATITTGAGADTVTGGRDEDVINTGSEADKVNSSDSADNITLGAGNDIYDLNSVTHSVVSARDVITDFSANTVGQGAGGAVTSAGATNTVADRNGDLIDLDSLAGLTAINVGVQANAADAQTFIQNGGADATGAVNAALDSSTGLLYIDINDNGNIDSVIELTGVTTIDAAAFLI